MKTKNKSSGTGTEATSRWSKFFPLIGLAVFSAALWAMYREISHFKFADFKTYLYSLSGGHIALTAGATVFGYLTLISYDVLAFRYVREKLALGRIAFTAFISYAFSMNIGQAVLSGGAVRMRLYNGWGIGAGEISRVIGFNFVVGLIGQFLVGGLAFLLSGVSLPEGFPLPFQSLRWLGIILLGLVAAAFLMVIFGKDSVKIGKHVIEFPRLRLFIPAVIVAAVDWSVTAVVLYALMPANMGMNFGHFMGIVMVAHTGAFLSMVPGGLGVFETIILHLMPDSVPPEQILSALIAYRAIYYLLPFIAATLLLAGHEIHDRRKGISEISSKFGGWISPLLPQLIAAMVFTAGAILLLSGATPAISTRLQVLNALLPVGAIELSHFLGSIVGISLIILSGALRRCIDAAWTATVLLLFTGIVASLVKGLDYEEALFLGLILFVLILARPRFHRKASLFTRRFTSGWWFTVGIVISTIVWIGFTSYERVNYHENLWLHFGIKGDAPRFLRSTVGIATALACFAIWQLLRPANRTDPPIAGAAEIEKILPLVKSSDSTESWLAVLGDKRFLFSESGRSAIMFGIKARTWISMGDPIGDASEFEDLAWTFRENADAAGARAAFYQVNSATAHTYAGIGMLLYKLGEEAKVDLRTFSMAGSRRSGLRHSKSRLDRDGVTFEIIESDRFEEILPELRAISDSWLSEKSAAEKGFSLGRFDERYLRHFDFAVIRHNGVMVAFANLWKCADKSELSVDLMRYSDAAPQGVMEYLFISLIAWGQMENYRWFNLGMAPLSGLENRALAPLWSRLGAQIFTHGEHFYNFQGLRAYKEKFDPVWEPRYLACRNSVQLPLVLLDTSALIGGGISKSIRKRS